MSVANPSEIDITYQPLPDRIWLSIRGQGGPSDWWLTRRITLRLLASWVQHLDATPWPEIRCAPGLTIPAPSGLADAHTLALEHEGPRKKTTQPQTAPDAVLVESVQLQVAALECSLQLMAGRKTLALHLTRQQTHAFLEALAIKSRQAQWLETVALPVWLGVASTP